MEDFLNIIQNVGFPIAVTLWFMFRTEKVIQANTQAMYKVLDKLNLTSSFNLTSSTSSMNNQ